MKKVKKEKEGVRKKLKATKKAGVDRLEAYYGLLPNVGDLFL